MPRRKSKASSHKETPVSEQETPEAQVPTRLASMLPEVREAAESGDWEGITEKRGRRYVRQSSGIKTKFGEVGQTVNVDVSCEGCGFAAPRIICMVGAECVACGHVIRSSDA